MGFGILFIGYFIAFLMSFHEYGFVFEILGYGVMLTAVGKLSEYRHRLTRAGLPLFLLALCSLADGAVVLSGVLEMNIPFPAEMGSFLALATSAVTVVLQFLLLVPLADIAREADEEELAKKIRPALGLSVLAAVATFTTAVLSLLEVSMEIIRYPFLAQFFLSFLSAFSVLFFIYHCYARLCAPEDVDMPQRPSRFAFINRMRERREQKSREVNALRGKYQADLEKKHREKQESIQKKRKRK